MMSVRGLAKQIGVSPTFISNLKKGKRFADLPTAVRAEIATYGKIKVEDIVRPSVAEALREYLSLRCMPKTSHKKEQEESGKEKEEVTVER